MHLLSAAFAIAAGLRLDLAHVDHVPEHVAGTGLHHRPAEIRTEPRVNPRHLVAGVAPPRQAAEQNEAGTAAERPAQPRHVLAEALERKVLRRDLGEVARGPREEVP